MRTFSRSWALGFALVVASVLSAASVYAVDFGYLPEIFGPCFLKGPHTDALPYKTPPKGTAPFFVEAAKKDLSIREVLKKAEPGCFLFEVNPKSEPVLLQGREWKLGLIFKNGCPTSVDRGSRQGVAEYLLARPYSMLSLLAGLDEAGEDPKARMSLQIFGDGKELARATCLKLGEPKLMSVDLKGVKRLTFVLGVYVASPGLKNPARASIASVYAW